MEGREAPVVVEIKVSASQDEAWSALTDIKLMTEWYFDNIPAFELRIGFETKFPVESEERKFTHIWKIVEINDGASLAYEWSFEEYPGLGLVTFEIEDHGNERLIRVVNTGLDSFPADIPEFTTESCTGGWNYFMDKLKAFLDA